MIRKIQYATGRTYDAPQVLNISIESIDTDEFGLDEIVATFEDASRHIKGRVHTVVFSDGIGQAVLDAYDAGRYDII